MPPPRELVATLNVRTRADRLATLVDATGGLAAPPADGSRVSAGDTIITRMNNRKRRTLIRQLAA